MSLTPILFNPIIDWLPEFFFSLLLILIGYRYIRRNSKEESALRKSSKKMIWAAVIFYIGYPALLTIRQYYVWLADPLSKLLLSSPLSDNVPIPQFIKDSAIFQSHFGYFIFYSYGRFWVNSILAVSVSVLFYLFLKFLRKHKERFFEEGEVEMGFLTALIAGWPRFVVFVPIIFISVILISLFRMMVLKESYTTLGYPFLLAAFSALALGTIFISLLNVSVLYI